MGEKHFTPRPQNKISVPLKCSFPNFRRALPSFYMGVPPPPGFCDDSFLDVRVLFAVFLDGKRPTKRTNLLFKERSLPSSAKSNSHICRQKRKCRGALSSAIEELKESLKRQDHGLFFSYLSAALLQVYECFMAKV